jgi:hypothetical protein
LRFKPSLIVIIGVGTFFLIFNAIALVTALVPPKQVFLIFGGLIAFCVTMLRLEYGLYMLVFTLPWTLQFTVGKVEAAPIDIGSDDAILAGMVIGWLTHMAIDKTGPFLPSPLNLPLVAFITWAGLSLIPLGLTYPQSVLMTCGLHLIKWIESVFIFFVVLKVVNTEEQVKKFVILLLISCAVLAIAQMGLTATGRYGSEAVYGGVATRLVIPGLESNNILGAFYLIFYGIVLSLLVSSGIRHKGLIIGFTVLLSAATFFSYARACYLGLFAILMALTITGGGAKVRIPFIFIMIFLLFLVYFLPAVVERISMTVRVEHGGMLELDESARARLDSWKEGMRVLFERPTNPIIGIGFWGCRFHGAWGQATPHSQYVAYLVEMGIVGFLIFCWLVERIFSTILAVYRLSYPDDYFARAVSIGFLAGLVGLLVNCFFGESLESARITGPLWFMTALMVVWKNLKETEEEGEVEGEEFKEPYPAVPEKVTTKGRRFVDKYFG